MIQKQIKIFLIFIPIILFSQPKQYELSTVEFIGNKGISSSVLATTIYSKQSPGGFSQLINKVVSLGGGPVYFDSLLIQSDLTALKSLYQSKGYFKAKINSKFQLNQEDNEAALQFTIEEGEPAILKSYKIKGFEWIAAEYREYLMDYILRDTNRVYEDELVVAKDNYTLAYLRDHGYMLAYAAKPTVTVDTLKNSVDIELLYVVGKRYKISQIFTSRTGEGKDDVDDELLKDIVGIKIEDAYSTADNQRGQIRLLRTNLFNSVAINSIVSDTSGYTVPLSISGDVGRMNELSPELVLNDEYGTVNIGPSLNFMRKNFLGNARKLTLGTSIVAQNISEFVKNPSFADSTFYGYADARVGIEQPFLFGEPITTKLESYYTFQKRKDEYNSTLYGAKLSMDFELPSGVYLNSLSGYLNIERGEFLYQRGYLISLVSNSFRNNGESAENADSVAADLVDNLALGRTSVSTNVTLGVAFGANKTNDFLYPTSGYSLSFLLEDENSLAYLFGGSGYNGPQSIKIIATTTFYPDVYGTLTDALGIKMKIGNILTYRGDKADVPINQRLYAGGNNSVRGWGNRDLVPDPVFNINNLPQEELESVLIKGVAPGGFFLFEGSIETRNKVFGRIGTALFLDFGNTWNDIRDFRFDQIAVAAGVGLRYYSDFIPFRIDFAIKAYDPQDRRSIFGKQFWGELFQFQIGIAEAF